MCVLAVEGGEHVSEGGLTVQVLIFGWRAGRRLD
jgi:hypothetical protein